ncbi:MAG: hypothetical protein O3A46_00880 [Candidatus Poribacteria bacterium]|nr:hypothetical protein [Candidatus Poribacteria bacterium]
MKDGRCYAIVGLIDMVWRDQMFPAAARRNGWRAVHNAARKVYLYFEDKDEAAAYLEANEARWRIEDHLPARARFRVSIVNRPKPSKPRRVPKRTQSRHEDDGQPRLPL